MPPDLTTLPALRTLAEERAREAHDLFARFTWGIEDGWSELDDDAQATLVRVHLTLLADLTRRASRNDVADIIAEAVCARAGWPAPSSVSFQFRPGMLVNVVMTVFIEGKINSRQIEGWAKPPPNGDGVREPKPGEDDQGPRYRVTIGRRDDPAEALAAVAFAVLR